MLTVPAKTILTRPKKPSAWFGLEYNMNLYRGCCHGCVYCDSRSDCYRIEQFDTVKVKENALAIVRDELARRIKRGVVGTGAMSDPYNPFEKEERVTRHAMELVNAYGFGMAVATKSDLVLRDADVLQDIRGHSPVLLKFTVTTLDEDMAAKLEPRAPGPARRMAALESLAAQGFFTGILLMPVMPFLTDSAESIRGLVQAASGAGARFIYPSFGVTMRSGQREHLLAELDRAFPDEGLADRYRSRFGERYHCASPRARKLWGVFQDECQKTGILYNMQDIIRGYRQGYTQEQLSFF